MTDLKNLTLGEKQRAFPQMLANLINFAYLHGYELTLGDAYRDPRVFGHIGHVKFCEGKRAYGRKFSCHKLRLAQDFNLFKAGEYLTETEDHEFLGLFWEEMGGSWGGRFGDGNHYSIEHQGHE